MSLYIIWFNCVSELSQSAFHNQTNISSIARALHFSVIYKVNRESESDQCSFQLYLTPSHAPLSPAASRCHLSDNFHLAHYVLLFPQFNFKGNSCQYSVKHFPYTSGLCWLTHTRCLTATFQLVSWLPPGFLGHRPSNRLELMCVRPSVLPSIKSFYDFDLIWRVDKPRPDICTSMTDPTQGQDQDHSATGVPKIALFWVYISCTILAWSSRLMVDYDSMGPSLQLVRA